MRSPFITTETCSTRGFHHFLVPIRASANKRQELWLSQFPSPPEAKRWRSMAWSEGHQATAQNKGRAEREISGWPGDRTVSQPQPGWGPMVTRGDWGSPQCTVLFPERGSGCGLDSHPHPQWGLSHVIRWEKLLNHLSTTNMAPIQSFLNILSRWTSSQVWVQSLRSMW